jgi:hypothetical protein
MQSRWGINYPTLICIKYKKRRVLRMRNENNIRNIKKSGAVYNIFDKSLRNKRTRRAKSKMDRGSEAKLILSSILVLTIIIPLFIFLFDKLTMIIK